MDRASNAHERAERTHERAAEVHEAAAEFWQRQGNPEKAAREHALALKDREGAHTERLRGKLHRGPG